MLKTCFLYALLICGTIKCEQNFKTNSADDQNSCQCDLTKNLCDRGCCCDVDCSDIERETMLCKELDSSAACFDGLSLYRSNSPYGMKKSGNGVCIAQPKISATDVQINATQFTATTNRLSNVNSSITLPPSTGIMFGQYQHGFPIFRFIGDPTARKFSYFSLPNRQLTSQTCTGTQTITYMNDFQSTCTQYFDATSTTNELEVERYTNLQLVSFPENLASSTPSPIICVITPDASTGTYLAMLTLTIFYSNPTGISSCIGTTSRGSLNSDNSLQQTFRVTFLMDGGTTTNKVLRSGNPGYIRDSPVLAAYGVSQMISFSTFSANTDGTCNPNIRTPIVFGRNFQSFCQSTTLTCPSIDNLFEIFFGQPRNPAELQIFIGVQGNAQTPVTGSNNWVSVLSCSSPIGSSEISSCESQSFPSEMTRCYTRLDIEVVYSKLGAITNPQSVINRVIFHYRYSPTALTTPVLIAQTVTFEDISNAPITQGDLLPNPNVKVLGDFFYPFALNRASNHFSLLCVFVLFIVHLFR